MQRSVFARASSRVWTACSAATTKNIRCRAYAEFTRFRLKQRRRDAVTYHLGCCWIVDVPISNMRAPTMACSLGKDRLSAVGPKCASCSQRERCDARRRALPCALYPSAVAFIIARVQNAVCARNCENFEFVRHCNCKHKLPSARAAPICCNDGNEQIVLS